MSEQSPSRPIETAITAFLRDKGKGDAGESGNYRSDAARELDRFVSWLRDEDLGQEPTFAALDERTFRRYARFLVGRYGNHLTGSDVASTDGNALESLDFDEETRALLGIDDIQETLDQLSGDAEMDVEEMEQEADAITEGNDVNIKDPDAVIEEMDSQRE